MDVEEIDDSGGRCGEREVECGHAPAEQLGKRLPPWDIPIGRVAVVERPAVGRAGMEPLLDYCSRGKRNRQLGRLGCREGGVAEYVVEKSGIRPSVCRALGDVPYTDR